MTEHWHLDRTAPHEEDVKTLRNLNVFLDFLRHRNKPRILTITSEPDSGYGRDRQPLEPIRIGENPGAPDLVVVSNIKFSWANRYFTALEPSLFHSAVITSPADFSLY